MSLEILRNELKSGKVRNLYLFYGPEEYLKKYYMDSIENKLLNEDLREMNKSVLEGKVDIDRLVDHCTALPMFSERKVVIVKNSGLLKSKKKADAGDNDEAAEKDNEKGSEIGGENGSEKGGEKSNKDTLAAFLQNVPDHTCLIFYEDEINKKGKALDAIRKNGLVVEFAYQKPVELSKWVIKAFKSSNKEIDMAAASMLVEYSEQGMTEILNEINKVILFVGERTNICSSDIERVCTRSIKSRIFDLTDAVAERNCSRALRLLNDMISLKEPVPRIFYMLARQLRLVLQMKLMKAEGVGMNEAMSRLNLTPYAAGKVARQTGGFTVDMLKAAIKESLELDRAVKSSRLDDRMAVELLITWLSK